MNDFILNLEVSFCESGTSGFILRDTTGIGLYKYMPQDSAISNNYYRTCDMAFYDIVTYNTIDEKKYTGFAYIPKNDAGYEGYSFEYRADVDGWFTVHHLILPTTDWFRKVDLSQFEDGMYYVFNVAEEQAWRYDLVNGVVIDMKRVSTMDIMDNLTNINLLGVEESVFLIGNLEACFENHIKTIIYNNLYKDCGSQGKTPDIYRNRDIIWMAYELIRKLIKQCDYYEAQRLLERFQGCNGFCNSKNSKSSYSNGCNCK